MENDGEARESVYRAGWFLISEKGLICTGEARQKGEKLKSFFEIEVSMGHPGKEGSLGVKIEAELAALV